MSSIDDIIAKKRGQAAAAANVPADDPTNALGIQRKGFGKGIDVSKLALPQFESAEDTEKLGYGTPLFILDRGSKGCGKSSDIAHPNFPRPFGGPTAILTMSPETKKGLVDRFGAGVLNKVKLMHVGKGLDFTDAATAKEAFTLGDMFLDHCIDELHPDNLLVDDLQLVHEEVAPLWVKHDMKLDPISRVPGEKSLEFWGARKNVSVPWAKKALIAAQHCVIVTGYDKERKMVEKIIDGKKTFVKEFVPPKWVEAFEKPFDVVLVRSLGEKHEVKEGGAESMARGRFVEVETSKVNSLFPEGFITDVTGEGISIFWRRFEEARKSGLLETHSRGVQLTQTNVPPKES